MISWFILQSILTIGIFIVYVSNSGRSGGEIGMTPLAVMLAVFIQFLFSTALFFLLRKYVRESKRIAFFILNMLLYELAYLFFSDNLPVFKISQGGLIGFLNKGYSLSSVLSGVFTIIAFYVFNSIRRKNMAK